MKSLWLFDINRRTYRKDENGRSYGGPIWREHWQEHEVVGETKQSWLIRSYGARDRRVSKKGGLGIAFSLEDIEKQAFIQENRYRISEQVRSISDYDLLRDIASLIGYQEPK